MIVRVMAKRPWRKRLGEADRRAWLFLSTLDQHKHLHVACVRMCVCLATPVPSSPWCFLFPLMPCSLSHWESQGSVPSLGLLV